MGKKRTIDSKIRASQNFAKLSYRQRDLWQGIIAMADDQGRMHANPMYVRSAVWPYDDIKPEDVSKDLDVLYQADYLVLYQAEGTEYLQIVKWWEYQNMQWAGKSDYPAPDGWTDRFRYHGKGRKIYTENWDKPGGFTLSSDDDDVNDNDNDNDDDDDNATGQSKRLPSDKGSRLPSKASGGGIFSQSETAKINTQFEKTSGAPITPFIGEDLHDLALDAEKHRKDMKPGVSGADVRGCEWVVEAIKEAGRAKNDHYRNLSVNFVRAIVERWMQEGYRAPFKSAKQKQSERETPIPARSFR